ncbi:BnaC02g48680D [Brassica napus]|uniref:BnaC02g48680D protein n=1 Tax=Brassica napus TaxID=3708 RepID=A0A078J7X8_BRANA|nr:BnaC02g48680D [Brassica napus]
MHGQVQHKFRQRLINNFN